MSNSIALKYFNEAESISRKGLYEDAIVLYKKAIENDCDFVSAYYNIALLYQQIKKYDKAIANWKQVTKLAPLDVSAVNNLGVICFLCGRLYDAKKYFEQALLIDANYEDAVINLLKTQKKLDKTPQISAKHRTFVSMPEAEHSRQPATSIPTIDMQPPPKGKTFCRDQKITSDTSMHLQGLASAYVDIDRIRNIVDFRTRHLIEYTGIHEDQFDRLVQEADTMVQEAWDRRLQRGLILKEFLDSLPKNVLFHAANRGSYDSYWRLEYVVRILSCVAARNSSFLSVGIGFGDVEIYFSDKCNVTLLDISSRHQELAKFHADKFDADIRFLNDFKDIEGNRFDVVFVHNVLPLIENPMDLVVKLLHSLKPGGYFVTTGFWGDPDFPYCLPANERYRDDWLAALKRMGQAYVCTFRMGNWDFGIFQQTMTYSEGAASIAPVPVVRECPYDLTSDEFVTGWDTALKRASLLNIQRPTPHPEVSVVIPTMNRKEPLIDTINGILDCSERTLEIIIVDDSTDGTYEFIKDKYKAVKNIIIIHNETRLGGIPSVNLGLATSVGQYIFLVTDDLEVSKGWESNPIFLYENEPLCGAVVPLLLNPDGTIHRTGTIDGCRSRKYPDLTPVYGSMGSNAAGKTPGQYTDSQWVRECEWGQIYMFKRQIVEKVGGFDERYVKYMADLDIGYRIRLAGYKILYCPRSILKFRKPSGSSHNEELFRIGAEVHTKKWETYTVKY